MEDYMLLHRPASFAFRTMSVFVFSLLLFRVPLRPNTARSESLIAATITYGTTTPGAIGMPGEMDTYTFSANSGDVILIGMSHTSGNLWQRIRLFDPNGRLLGDTEDPVHAEISITLPNIFYVFLPLITRQSNGILNTADSKSLGFVAAVPGVYTILASDGFNGTLTGSYSLFLQKLNPPVNATAISFSQTVAGSINQPAEMDAFTISANANDRVIVGTSSVSGSMWQQIRLFDSNGVLLNEVSDPIHAEMNYPVMTAGTYAILVGDGFNGTLTGNYNVFIQRTNNPSNATTISFGQTLPGSINLPAEMDAFVFSGNANANVEITMTRVSGSLWQEVRLYDPSGELIGVDDAPSQARLTMSLPTTGTYVILASDGFNGTLTGSYNLTLQQLP
jgi:hypothetical protein